MPSAFIVSKCTYLRNGTFGQLSSFFAIIMLNRCPSGLQTFADPDQVLLRSVFGYILYFQRFSRVIVTDHHILRNKK